MITNNIFTTFRTNDTGIPIPFTNEIHLKNKIQSIFEEYLMNPDTHRIHVVVGPNSTTLFLQPCRSQEDDVKNLAEKYTQMAVDFIVTKSLEKNTSDKTEILCFENNSFGIPGPNKPNGKTRTIIPLKTEMISHSILRLSAWGCKGSQFGKAYEIILHPETDSNDF